MKELYEGTVQNVGTSVKKEDMPTWEQVLQSLKPFPIAFEVGMIPTLTDWKEEGIEDIPKVVNNIVKGKYIWK